VRGADVAFFEGNGDADPDAIVFDPVEAFARAASLGMLGAGASAAIVARSADLAAREETWQLRTEGLAPGALRVLANMLCGRDLDEVELSGAPVAEGGGPPAARIDLVHAAYPALPSRLPFLFARTPPQRLTRDRWVHLVFAAPPAIALVEEVYEAFEAWDRLLLLGAYPAPGRTARASGALPDLAFQLDACTVEQAFPDLFLCDEACFSALVGHACRLHERGALIDRVEVG